MNKKAEILLDCKIESIIEELAFMPRLDSTFENCFMSTIQTTTELMEDGSTYVFTGDIPAMWLRDSSAQVKHYIKFASNSSYFQRVIEGLIKRQIMYILIDPYANAFNKNPDGQGHSDDVTMQNPWLWERKYEIDSLCYPVELAYLYWKASGNNNIFDENFKSAIDCILNQFKKEQKHSENSSYRFERHGFPKTDTLRENGIGMPVNYTGMTWSAFRPSDDVCKFGYHIPSNMFAVVVLGYISEISNTIYHDSMTTNKAKHLAEEIEYGINTYGKFLHPIFGLIYAYETDGFGNYNIMDDANVPSLLSIPYIGYRDAADPIYQNTRRFALSRHNPQFYEGKFAKGIGSPHTDPGFIWTIGIIMQALTSTDRIEILQLIKVLMETDAGTGFMHESFNADNPEEYTREWFSWANSLFAELIISNYSDMKQLCEV